MTNIKAVPAGQFFYGNNQNQFHQVPIVGGQVVLRGDGQLLRSIIIGGNTYGDGTAGAQVTSFLLPDDGAFTLLALASNSNDIPNWIGRFKLSVPTGTYEIGSETNDGNLELTPGLKVTLAGVYANDSAINGLIFNLCS